ncbi:MAG: hypothetical protein PHV48_04995 [Candidatus Omnitrophica bacterium]|nr:hypothetical protein [Candidatus Omnitrophota bacterium]
MKLSGWIFMIISWAFILSLAAFCFSRIFKKGLGGDGGKKTADKTKKEKNQLC